MHVLEVPGTMPFPALAAGAWTAGEFQWTGAGKTWGSGSRGSLFLAGDERWLAGTETRKSKNNN